MIAFKLFTLHCKLSPDVYFVSEFYGIDSFTLPATLRPLFWSSRTCILHFLDFQWPWTVSVSDILSDFILPTPSVTIPCLFILVYLLPEAALYIFFLFAAVGVILVPFSRPSATRDMLHFSS